MSSDNSVTLQLYFVAGLTGAEYESDCSHQEGVYFSAVGRSFFEQCFPRNSVYVGFSSHAMVYLSTRFEHFRVFISSLDIWLCSAP